MNSRDVVRRLRAFQKGGPIPCGQTRRFHIAEDEDLLIVAFIRMGGESRPWGIAYGHPDSEPALLAVPEGRNRDLVADMCADFAPVLLRHLRTPNYVADAPEDWTGLRPLRQIWVPNSSHLDMLHHLAYAYAFTKWGAGKRGRLNAFGRACGWLFREAQRAGEQHVMVATDALRNSFTFPAQEMRQGHLGFLLAWLDSDGDRDSRWHAATLTERESMSASLDPVFERESTEDLVDEWQKARRNEDKGGMDRAAEELRGLLEPELRRRFALTERAVSLLRTDERRMNAGVMALLNQGLQEQWYQHTRMELRLTEDSDGPPFFASPETDRSPAAAGSRYQVHLASAELRDSLLLHDDPELQAEAIAAGDAFRGRIVSVVDEAEGRGRRPVWTVVDPIGGPLRLREGSNVCVVGLARRTATIRSIHDSADGSRKYELEITGWKTTPNDAASLEHVGTSVAFVKQSADNINRMKSMRIWSADGPGAWLTHRRPGGRRARIVAEAEEDLTATTPGDGDA